MVLFGGRHEGRNQMHSNRKGSRMRLDQHDMLLMMMMMMVMSSIHYVASVLVLLLVLVLLTEVSFFRDMRPSDFSKLSAISRGSKMIFWVKQQMKQCSG
jgi:hypothetical protein